MSKLSKDAVLAHHRTQEVFDPAASPDEQAREINVSSLDEEREWLELYCPNGHRLVVEAHEGGSVANCNQCGAKVDYRDAPEPEAETQTVAGSDVADLHEVFDGDHAHGADLQT